MDAVIPAAQEEQIAVGEGGLHRIPSLRTRDAGTRPHTA
jgi:hypothetical protein